MRDLRGLIEDWQANGQLKIVEGADADIDIGALAEVSGSGTEPPALLFDKIKGYADGYRVLINMFQTQRRTAESLGVDATLRGPALVEAIRKRMENHEPVPPKLVTSGPITEHVLRGKDIDVFKFPAPKIHKDDGGKYIGTQDAVNHKRCGRKLGQSRHRQSAAPGARVGQHLHLSRQTNTADRGAVLDEKADLPCGSCLWHRAGPFCRGIARTSMGSFGIRFCRSCRRQAI